MPYVTAKMGPRHSQMSMWSDLLNDLHDFSAPEIVPFNPSNTRTTFRDFISFPGMGDMLDGYVAALNAFNMRNARFLQSDDMHEFYYSFKIPKRSGGLRSINAPNEDLKAAQRELAAIFQDTFGVLYHTSAFAYVKKRSTIDCIKRHQKNESRWFLKLDFHDFFGSTTPDFVLSQFSQIWPFSGIMSRPGGRDSLALALSICFLDGGLPQGTPISPLLTNITMIPVDHQLSNGLRNFSDGKRDLHLVYTRYADDLLISSKVDFDKNVVISYIKSVLSMFGGPFHLNDSKTRYGSSAGSNWNLGVMLNKDNQITIGHKNKEKFKAMLFTYINDRRSGSPWELSDVQALAGKISYYRMVEPEAIGKIIEAYNKKFDTDIMDCIKHDVTT